jgi:NAD(P)-dependent dehydrogenase (short-subunit alcohol dehydrogenase family)
MTNDEARKDRRRLLGGLAIGTVAGLAGAAAGAAVAHDANAVPPPRIEGPKRFRDKVVLITGGTSGIGRASVIAFADEGAKVVFCGRRRSLGAEVEALVRSRGGDAAYVWADVRQEASIKALVAEVKRRHGRLDVAFNNAGVSVGRPLHETSVADYENVMDTNVRGVFLCLREQIPLMLGQGSGVILITSSVQSVATRPGSAAYSASKRGLLGLMQVAALEYGARGIRVNALCPGTVDTPMVRELGGAADLPDPAWAIAAKAWGRQNVAGLERMATADEMARAALWLSSDEMSYLNGSAVLVDGGMTSAL